MRIGIDCDGVLRDFIPDLINKIKETHPEHADKIGTPHSWDWEDWLPFWTEDETEKYVFEDHFEELFGPKANVIPSSLEDWPKLKEWAKENGNDLITPHPEFDFPGLKEGDCWCVCAGTYAQSIDEGTACKIYLKKTNKRTLEIISLEKLKNYAIDLS